MTVVPQVKGAAGILPLSLSAPSLSLCPALAEGVHKICRASGSQFQHLRGPRDAGHL